MAGMSGRPHSEASRRKIAEANKRIWGDPKKRAAQSRRWTKAKRAEASERARQLWTPAKRQEMSERMKRGYQLAKAEKA